MPFETKRIVKEADAYLVQVTYTVERRQIVTITAGVNEKKLLAEAEKQMREDILRTVVTELHLEATVKALSESVLKGGEDVGEKRVKPTK